MPFFAMEDPLTWMLGTVVLVGLVWTAVRPSFGIGIAILSLSVTPPAPSHPQGWILYVWVGFAIYLFGVISIHYLVLPSERTVWLDVGDAGFHRGILIFLALVVASLPVSFIYNSDYSLLERANLYLRGGAAFFFFAFYFIFRQYFYNQKRSAQWLVFLLVAIFVVLIRSIIVWVQDPTLHRITGAFDIARFEYFAIGFILSTVIILHWERPLFRLGALLLCGGFTAGMILSGARGQILATIAGVSIVWFWKVIELRSARRLISVAVLVPFLLLVFAGGLSVFVGSQDARITKLWSKKFGRSFSESKRFEEIREATDHFKESPLWGKGLGFSRHTKVDYGRRLETRERIGFVHSSLAYFLLTMGILGTASFLWMFWAWGRVLWRNRYHWCTNPIVVASSACVVSLFVSGLFRAMFKNFQFGFLLGLLWALSLSTPLVKKLAESAPEVEKEFPHLDQRAITSR